MSRRRIDSVVVGAAALALYLHFCPPVIGLGDSGELTLVLATNGVAHPTGYPLYTLAGHYAVLLFHALGWPWPLAANAWSAVGGAVAIGVLHALASDLAGAAPGIGPAARSSVALLALVPLALDPVFMDAATEAEVNVWSAAWTAVAAFVFMGTLRRLGGAAPVRLGRAAAVWGLVCGAGLAHHATSVLVSIPLSVGIAAALRRRGRLSLRLVAVAAAAALVPLASYGIVAWRAWHPVEVQWGWLEPGLGSVVGHITGFQYHAHFGGFAPGAGNLLGRAVYPLLIPGLACLLWISAAARAGMERVARWSLFAAAAAVTGFSFLYRVPDPEPYFLAPMMLGSAGAAAAAAGWLRAPFAGRALRVTAGAIAVAGLAALAAPWCREAAGVRRELIDYEVLIRQMWESIPPDTAIVLWRDDRVQRLRAYQVLGGEKRALFVETPDALLSPRSRARFAARFGFDPLEGIAVPSEPPGSAEAEAAGERIIQAVVAKVNARTLHPVIEFDPAVPVVRKLYKPWERAAHPRP